MNMNTEDTIVALSTPIGEGGIGIVRMSGPDALTIADKIFLSKDGKKPSGFKTYTIHYGHIVNNNTQYAIRTTQYETVDEVLLTVMRAPKSYTKENVVEINCHGGIRASKEVLDLVVACGARVAEPGEFTRRAFLNGRIDLAQAEGVLDVIRAKTDGAFKVARAQLEGEFSRKVRTLLNEVLDIASEVEASIDFPDEELDILTDALRARCNKATHGVKELVDTFRHGAILREGILAVICGKPNAGKSSLMNLLLKRDRVIVTPIPGTTRDAVEEMIDIRGIPVRIVDTAGIAGSKQLLDKESVKKSKRYIKLADIVLLLLDGSRPFDAHDKALVKLIGNKKRIVVLNKTDLARKITQSALKKYVGKDAMVEISAKKRTNIDRLEQTIADVVWSGTFSQGESILVTNARHKELLDKACKNMLSVCKACADNAPPDLIAVDLKEASFNLGLIIGKSVSGDILDRIFEKFCIGK